MMSCNPATGRQSDVPGLDAGGGRAAHGASLAAIAPCGAVWPGSRALGLLLVSSLGLLAACTTTPLPRSGNNTGLPPVAGSATAPAVAGAPPMPAANSGRGGYYQDDGPGDNPPPNLLQTPDAEPKVEPISKTTSRSYTVFGKTYTPINDDRPFKQRGIGSWYGKKFHGQRTASGERYDMYKMTAAHPTLPIPSYARVTSLDSGKSVIVRINDRGPFHATRITDLSYTAALKLGLLGKGSHEVEIERLLPDEIARIQRQQHSGAAAVAVSPVSVPAAVPAVITAAAPSSLNPQADKLLSSGPVQAGKKSAASPVSISNDVVANTIAAVETGSVSMPPASEVSAMENSRAGVSASYAPAATAMAAPAGQTEVATEAKSGIYLQLGAYSQANNAESMRMKLASNWQAPWPALQVVQAGSVYRLYSGPFDSRAQAQDVAERMQNDGLGKALVVQR